MQHKDLAIARWGTLTLMEQLANIGSEVIRATNWQKKGNTEYATLAFYRALELTDCTLAQPLFDESGTIRPEVTFADLAAHVYFTETGEPIPKRATGKTPLIGQCKGTAYYLLFNGVLGDKRPDGGNVLTGRTLAQLPPHNGPKVVYGEGCRLGAARLKREKIVFKQVPYEVKVS